MSFEYDIEITTDLGDAKWRRRANSAKQSKDQLPTEVRKLNLTIVPLSSNSIVVDDQELFIDLMHSVNHIEYASSLGTN